ncbi:MAG TPA: hypothetical protein VGL51_13140 [Solirubrobacteraceae bacterium]|jgi:hypothetical protein
MPRRFVIAQFPNRELLCTLAAGAVARTASGDAARAAAVVSEVALLVWAYEELVNGVNWFRWLLGAGAAANALGLLPGPRVEA